MIVTIDGPAGSGKSTAARKLAARLEIAYLDTGAMYRAIAYVALEAGVNLDDAGSLADVAARTKLSLDCGPTFARITANGHDVSEAIRTMAVSRVTSRVAVNQRIRQMLVEQQRRIGTELKSFVTEGRDQGTVVFPDADHKFVLLAAVEKRALRRHQQFQADGEEVAVEAVIENLQARDGVDQKQWENLLTSGKATVIDTSDMSIAAVVDRMAEVLTIRDA